MAHEPPSLGLLTTAFAMYIPVCVFWWCVISWDRPGHPWVTGCSKVSAGRISQTRSVKRLRQSTLEQCRCSEVFLGLSNLVILMGMAGVEPWICAFRFYPLGRGPRAVSSLANIRLTPYFSFLPCSCPVLTPHPSSITRNSFCGSYCAYVSACVLEHVWDLHVCMFNDINDNTALPIS